MAHQAHMLPWGTLSSNLKFIVNNHHVTPHKTDLFPLRKSGEANDLAHFTRVFASAISDFSHTERAKFPPAALQKEQRQDKLMMQQGQQEQQNNEMIIPNEVFQQVKEILLASRSSWSTDTSQQLLSTWTSSCPYTGLSSYTKAEIIKILLAQNQTATLLALAQHPDIHLSDWHLWSNSGWNVGITQALHTALDAYICLNVFYCFPSTYLAAENGPEKNDHGYRAAKSYRSMVSICTENADGTEYAFVHRRFFQGPADDNDSFGCQRPAVGDVSLQAATATTSDDDSDPLGEGNAKRLHSYLSFCWAFLVRMDVLARECGRPIDWEAEVRCVLHGLWGFNIYPSK